MDRKQNAELKNRLEEALRVRQMRAVDLVEATGVPKSAISFYLAGKSKPKADRLYLISRALDVSEAWLLGYDVPMVRTAESRKNDQLASLVVRMRKDPDFFEVVSMLANLPDAEYTSVKGLLSALGKK